MRKLIEFLLIFFLSNIVFANNIDSLKNVIYTSKNDTDKLHSCIKLSNSLFYSKPDTAKVYYYKALKFAEKLNLQKKQIQIEVNLGILFNETGKLSEAKKFLNKAYKTAVVIKDTSYITKVLGNLGNMYMINGEYEKALQKFNKVITFYEKINNNAGKAMVYGAIGNLYTKMENYDKAILFYKKAKKIFTEINAPKNNIATINLNEGIIYYHQKKLKKAKELLELAFVFFNKNDNMLNEAKSLSILGNIYSKEKSFNKAEDFYKKALDIYKKLDSKTDVATQFYNIGSLEYKQNNIKKSILYLKKSYDIAKKINNFYLQEKISAFLADDYSKINDYKNAYKFSVINKQFSDSILNTETSKKIAELEIKYQTAEKNRKLESLAKSKQLLEQKQKTDKILLIALIISIIVIILISVLIYNKQKLKAINREMQTNQKLYRLQMNPHFIFNALSTIQQFMINNDIEKSNKYLRKFSRLMRMILQSTNQDFITLTEEIQIIEHYLNIQQVLKNNIFDYEIRLSEEIDADNKKMLPVLLQPFVENSIKHAFKNISYKGKIQIIILEKNNYIYFEIIDNGIGIKDLSSNKKHKSMAIDITKNRLKTIFNGKLKKSRFEIKNITNNNKTGTKVSFRIPNKEIF